MPKNLKGGKKYKSLKREPIERPLIFREDDQKYYRIIKLLGDGRAECQNFENNETIIGKICGSMRRKVWIKQNDIVLGSIRDFNDSVCDIIHKYTNNEAIFLKNCNEIPSNINLQASIFELSSGKLVNNEDDLEFEFEDM
jgi:translation initiation factor 1A